MDDIIKKTIIPKSVNEKIDMKAFSDKSMKFYLNDFTNGMPQIAKAPLTRLLDFLMSIPKAIEKEFASWLLGYGGYVYTVVGIVFSGMRGVELEKVVKTYDYLITEEEYTKKPRQMLNAILETYNIEFSIKKILFSKKANFKFPSNFYECIKAEMKATPIEKEKRRAISDEGWDKFVDWWAEVDENKLKDDLHLGAFQLMWYFNEIMNGGYDQFFDNKSNWDFYKTTSLFKDLLPKKELANFEKALKNFKNNKDNESLNARFEEELVQDALDKIAARVVKSIK